jgi:hypothetical protein
VKGAPYGGGGRGAEGGGHRRCLTRWRLQRDEKDDRALLCKPVIYVVFMGRKIETGLTGLNWAGRAETFE